MTQNEMEKDIMSTTPIFHASSESLPGEMRCSLTRGRKRSVPANFVNFRLRPVVQLPRRHFLYVLSEKALRVFAEE